MFGANSLQNYNVVLEFLSLHFIYMVGFYTKASTENYIGCSEILSVCTLKC